MMMSIGQENKNENCCVVIIVISFFLNAEVRAASFLTCDPAPLLDSPSPSPGTFLGRFFFPSTRCSLASETYFVVH